MKRIEVPENPIPNIWLMKYFSIGAKAPDSQPVEILGNAMEENLKTLVPDQSYEIVSHLQFTPNFGRPARGIRALTLGFSRTLGAVASRAGWGMDAPEVTYMIGRVSEELLNEPTLVSRLHEATAKFASLYFPGDPTYVEVLNMLKESTNVVSVERKIRTCEAIAQGKKEDAPKILLTPVTPRGHFPIGEPYVGAIGVPTEIKANKPKRQQKKNSPHSQR